MILFINSFVTQDIGLDFFGAYQAYKNMQLNRCSYTMLS